MYRTFILLIIALSAAQTTQAAVIDFEDVPLATVYGSPAGDSAGDIVLTRWDVDMSVEDFTLGAFVNLGRADVVTQPTSFFPPAVNSTQVLQINNINTQFDFTGVPYDVTQVSFDYVDLGGEENFDLNGLGRQEVGLLSNVVPYAGFTINVSQIGGPGGVYGSVEVIADPGNRIETLLVGGQEFAIDNLRKVPEPAAASLLASMITMVVGLRRRT